MADAVPFGLPEPTQDERTMAVLAHVLQLVGWWVAPLIILLVKRDSKFVSFHALQALLLQAVYVLVMIMFAILWFITIFATVLHHTGPGNPPPPAVFILIPLVWLGFMGMWLALLVFAIVYGIKAGQGQWADYPVLGRIARNILKLDSGTAPA